MRATTTWSRRIADQGLRLLVTPRDCGRRGHAAHADDFITIEVEADGFLYNMVRAIVGLSSKLAAAASRKPGPATCSGPWTVASPGRPRPRKGSAWSGFSIRRIKPTAYPSVVGLLAVFCASACARFLPCNLGLTEVQINRYSNQGHL